MRSARPAKAVIVAGRIAAATALALLAGTAAAEVAAPGRRPSVPTAVQADAPVPDAAAHQAAALKVQQAAQARDKAWDARMRRTMSSICNGC